MNPDNARPLVPPRPNLGPEPWSEAAPIALYFALGATLAALLIGWLIWTRLRRKRARRALHGIASGHSPPDTSPRGRLVALSQSIRGVLANQFGPAWRAKTNEELSSEPRLLESLGNDQLEELIRFLDHIDRLKFAPNRSNHQQESLEEQLATWEPRLAELGKKIKARPERRVNNGAVRPEPGQTWPEARAPKSTPAAAK